MSSRQERSEEKQRHKLKMIIMALVPVIVLLVAGVGWGVSHQLNKNDKIGSARSSNSISSKSYSRASATSDSISSTVDSEDISGGSDSSFSSTESNGVTKQEWKMFDQRQMIVLGMNKSIYYDRGKDVPNFSYMTEIPHGFTVYFDNGDVFNVKEAASSEELTDAYDFGNNQGWQTEVDGESIILEKPTGMGGVYLPPTEQQLHQYGIR